ncbi:phage major capsid protein [bacterium]|nr:phage major capsid protein [bacterium]
MNPATTFPLTAEKLGPADHHRQERLLNIGDLLSRSGGGSVSLRWPDSTDEILADRRRDLLPAAGTSSSGLQTFEAQIRQHSAIVRAGASAITLPRHQTSALPTLDRTKRAAWVSTAADVAPTMDMVASAPLRLSAYITASRQLFKTSPTLAAAFVEKQLLSAIGAAIDHASLTGTGTDQPYGLLNEPDLLTFDCNTSAYTLADCTEMERLVSAAHGENESASLGWLADPATRKSLRALPRISGKEIPVWPDLRDIGPLGYRGTVSPWAPAGTLIFGNFGDLLILQSGSVEIINDPTRAEALAGYVTLIVAGYFDIVSLNPGHSFVRGI